MASQSHGVRSLGVQAAGDDLGIGRIVESVAVGDHTITDRLVFLAILGLHAPDLDFFGQVEAGIMKVIVLGGWNFLEC